MAAPWARNDRLVGTDLTGQKPNTVSKPDQDAVALALYRRTNSALLGGPCS
jgi:hypothetical protein